MTRRVRVLLLVLLVGLAGCIEFRDVTPRPAPPTPTPRAVAPRAAITYIASPTGDDSSGAVCTEGTPCSIRRGVQKLNCSANDVLELLGTPASPGIYRGDNYMLRLDVMVPGKSGTDDAHRCTVRARHDGGVVIDGQQSRPAFILDAQSYWTFEGIDLANSGGCTGCNSVGLVNPHGSATGVVFRRVVAYQSAPITDNQHIWEWGNCVNCLFEDIAGFGPGRDTFVYGGNTAGTTVRRAWLRWNQSLQVTPEWGAVAPVQGCYNCYGSPLLFENMMLMWSPFDRSVADEAAGVFYRGTGPGEDDKWRGTIVYATANVDHTLNQAYMQFAHFETTSHISVVDAYVDTRGQNAQGGSGTGGPFFLGGDATQGSANRLTSVRLSGQVASLNQWGATNLNECIATASATGSTLGGCPDFYTGAGTAGAVGARNCQEYQDGTLTSTSDRRLWPWRMDDRIKAARARAGFSALAGAAGPGYASSTVTSEIVSRYGAIPGGCLRGTGTTPNPPAGLNLTERWRAIWTPLAGIR